MSIDWKGVLTGVIVAAIVGILGAVVKFHNKWLDDTRTWWRYKR
jgi:hypothetical protein